MPLLFLVAKHRHHQRASAVTVTLLLMIITAKIRFLPLLLLMLMPMPMPMLMPFLCAAQREAFPAASTPPISQPCSSRNRSPLRRRRRHPLPRRRQIAAALLLSAAREAFPTSLPPLVLRGHPRRNKSQNVQIWRGFSVCLIRFATISGPSSHAQQLFNELISLSLMNYNCLTSSVLLRTCNRN